MEEIMGIEGIYAMMKQIREEMYADGKQTVTLGQAEFFALYQLVCYMMQIRHIITAQE